MNETAGREYVNFQDSEVGQSIHRWHEWLENNRGERARLRRARTLLDVYQCRGFHRLLDALRRHGSVSDERLARATQVVAHVDTPIPESQVQNTAELMARSEGADGPRVSESRFRRLIVSEEDEVARQLIRILPLLDNASPIVSLISSVYFWNDQIKRKWSLTYYDYADLS